VPTPPPTRRDKYRRRPYSASHQYEYLFHYHPLRSSEDGTLREQCYPRSRACRWTHVSPAAPAGTGRLTLVVQNPFPVYNALLSKHGRKCSRWVGEIAVVCLGGHRAPPSSGSDLPRMTWIGSVGLPNCSTTFEMNLKEVSETHPRNFPHSLQCSDA